MAWPYRYPLQRMYSYDHARCVRALNLTCPFCGSQPGDPCVGYPSGEPTSHIHLYRLVMAGDE